jgi:hypothetical protein
MAGYYYLMPLASHYGRFAQNCRELKIENDRVRYVTVVTVIKKEV